ncbi:hypothetical protein [Paenibacillus elgii]|uniref:hypothetical protein n=1 Tax=Paenibacillus elgii TaxID=189691 RepID=UPI001300C981|nr:hypothetical protein [Paenibacillus elgii]
MLFLSFAQRLAEHGQYRQQQHRGGHKRRPKRQTAARREAVRSSDGYLPQGVFASNR